MKRSLLLPLLLLGSCADAPPPVEQPPAEVGLSAADSARALQAGDVATAVAQGLVQRLQARLDADGAPAAIEFCAESALLLTDSVAGTAAMDATVKRTSLRVRNRENAPDSLERVVLAFYDSVRAAGGTLPPAYLQADGHDVRYYRPLMVQPFCVQCHGAEADLDPAVRAMVQQRYPADSATGYAAGDWRGLIRVSVPRH